ncbi:MAG: Ppx/GppA phosphatase family protein [Myxococcota bacterium]
MDCKRVRLGFPEPSAIRCGPASPKLLQVGAVRLAAIDIGTNSIHMVVVENLGDTGFEVVDRAKNMVKLGAGLFRARHMTDRAFDAGLDTIRRYCKLAQSLGAEEILAVATSATREADNGGAFLKAVFRDTGLSPKVISGQEEARLIFRAVRHALHVGDDRVMVLDIGGGSVEAVVGERDRVMLSESMRLGVQRLLDGREKPDPLPSKRIHQLRGYIEGAAQDVITRAKDAGFQQVIGTSGTIRTLGEAVLMASGGPPHRTVNAQVVKRKALKDLAKRLISMDREHRARVDGIPEERADAIHLGAEVLAQLLEMAGAETITLCDASLREGIVLDYLDDRRKRPSRRPTDDVRLRSVLELAEKYDRDDPGDRHIASLATSLFDQTSALHGLSKLEREWLRYAALLNGVGQHINFTGHHKHAAYVIRHARLRGLTDEEVALIALVVRYQRKSLPAKRHKKYRKLSKELRHTVRVLSGVLRLALGLDRGRTQQVKHVTCSIEEDRLRIVAHGAADLELETYAARVRSVGLAKALKREVVVEAASRPAED